MNTKEKILREGLNLFAKKGFANVSLEEIAQNVGIKAPSLYKHYRSKEDIFNNCVAFFKEQMDKKREEHLLPKEGMDATIYLKKSRDEIIKIAVDLFNYHLTDEVASNFRKLLLKDRYYNQNLNDIYIEIYIDSPIKFQEEVFNSLVENGKFKKDNPQIIATNFYSPIYFLIQKYDMDIKNIREAEQELIIIINNFCDKYEANDER